MGKSEETLDKAFIIYKNLCEYQRGQLIDWQISSYLIIQACHLDNVDVAFAALTLAKSVLGEVDVLHVRREILRLAVSNPSLQGNINNILLREITELKQLKQMARPEEEYPLEAERPTLSQRIIAGLAGTEPPNDDYSHDENSYDECSSEEEAEDNLYRELFERKKEIVYEAKRTTYPIQSQPKTPPVTAYEHWSPSYFRQALTLLPSPRPQVPSTPYQPWSTSSLGNPSVLKPTAYALWDPSSLSRDKKTSDSRQEETKVPNRRA
jgi:hypothetical protein